MSQHNREDKASQTLASQGKSEYKNLTLCSWDGIIPGAYTRAMFKNTVSDRNCEKIHNMAPDFYCCGAGTAGDKEAVTETLLFSTLASGSLAAMAIFESVMKDFLLYLDGLTR
ncbi:hypothetical protein POTOM_035520 [Populus tomentosa]|uniref:Uncharacterized protein n=1 Tax=Populus tomentosa TaxID=118781 RepID=A0A8X7Z8W6_POPTO|nr:hypothetical protein POTOM_035520 [Populus tomentosa]